MSRYPEERWTLPTTGEPEGPLLGSLGDSPSPPNSELLLLICVSVLKALLTLHIFVFSSVQDLVSPPRNLTGELMHGTHEDLRMKIKPSSP